MPGTPGSSPGDPPVFQTKLCVAHFLPVPLSETVSDGLLALLVTVKLPLRVFVPVGVNVTDSLHFPPGLSGPRHAPAGTAKSPEADTPRTVIVLFCFLVLALLSVTI